MAVAMPQIRYYHHGRYYRPARPMPLLPPLSLVPAVDPSKHEQLRLGCPNDEAAVTRRWKSRRDKEFRWMVRYIGESLTGENIADMRFLCRDHVHPPEVLRQTMKGAKLMTILERHRLLAENSLFFLQTLLYYVARPDLYELVLEYRSKRQKDMRKIGVEIMFDMNHPNERGISLTRDLKSFRTSLKRRSRFNTVDVQAMMKRLSELKARMQSQLPKTIDRSYAKSVLSSVPQSNASDSEWEDVDTDDDLDDDVTVETATNVDESSSVRVGETKDNAMDNDRRTSIIASSGFGVRASQDKEKVRLPVIGHKTNIEVKIKTGCEGESDYEDESADDGTTTEDGENEGEGDVETHKTKRIPGPSKPIHNFTHRSSEFADLKVNGKQTYSDDDVIACVRDVNKVAGTSSNKLEGGNADTSGTLTSFTAQRPVNVKPKVPLKIKVLRRRYRKDSPGRRVRNFVKRHKTSKVLPQLKPASQPSSSLEQLKTTRSIPTHAPQRINFLPDIYDKYARKSVSTAKTKTPVSRKSKNR